MALHREGKVGVAMPKTINIFVSEDGIVSIQGVPEDVQIHVYDGVEDTHAYFGEGNDNILSQKV